MRTLSRLLLVSVASTMLIPSLAAARNGADDAQAATPTTSPEVHSTSGDSGSGKVERLPDATPRVKVEGGQFCLRFTDATGTVSSETSDRFNKLNDNFATRGQKIDSDFAELSQKQGQNRAEANSKLTTKFAELDAKATTADQKAAVAQYKASVLAAVAKRRAAVDAR